MREPILHDYRRPTAFCRDRISLNLQKISYLTDPVDPLAGDQRRPANPAQNPKGLVPCLQTDGLGPAQSLAILEVLDKSRSAGWLPQPTPSGQNPLQVGPLHDGSRVTIHPALWHGLQNASETLRP